MSDRTDEARAEAVARYGPMAPLAEIQRAAFVAGWEAGAKEERERWCASVQAIFDAQYPPGILLALDALKLLVGERE